MTTPTPDNKKINVLIYSGPSTSPTSVVHTTASLRHLLGPNYAIHPLSLPQLLSEPWTSTCALLIIPGGADLGYVRALEGEGNRRIRNYVNLGGKYLGLCAGGYYGSGTCEFEVGRAGMEVVGERVLKFYPGICRGGAYPGYEYGSEAGARAAGLVVQQQAFEGREVPRELRVYFNGGGVFIDAELYADKGVQVLANYAQDLGVRTRGGRAAVIYCKVGEGAAILTGPHPEYVLSSRRRPSADSVQILWSLPPYAEPDQ